MVARLVRDDAKQPGPERPARVEAVEGAERLHARLLGDVLGLLGGAQDEVGGPKGHVLVQAQQRHVRIAVATACELDQLGFRTGRGHHTASYTARAALVTGDGPTAGLSPCARQPGDRGEPLPGRPP